jgi:hypothetical protein
VSWFFKAGLSAVMVAGVVVSIPISAMARYPDDNGHHYGQLSNPGHHYGQLKHHRAPAPNPSPASTPSTRPGPATVVALVADVISSVPDHSSGDGSSIPDLPIVMPVQQAPSDQVSLGGSAPNDEADWLVLLILPALLAVWLLLFARAALTASRRRGKSAA